MRTWKTNPSPEQIECLRLAAIVEETDEYKKYDDALKETGLSFKLVEKCISERQKNAAIAVWLSNKKKRDDLENIMKKTKEYKAFERAIEIRNAASEEMPK